MGTFFRCRKPGASLCAERTTPRGIEAFPTFGPFAVQKRSGRVKWAGGSLFSSARPGRPVKNLHLLQVARTARKAIGQVTGRRIIGLGRASCLRPERAQQNSPGQ